MIRSREALVCPVDGVHEGRADGAMKGLNDIARFPDYGDTHADEGSIGSFSQ